MRELMILIVAVLILTGCQSAPTRTTDSGVTEVATDIREITPAEAQVQVAKAYSQFVDVRTPEEYAGGHAARAINIPLDTLDANLDRLEMNEPIYFICESGSRSKKAAEKLKEAGFNNVTSVAGGTAAWKAAGLPMEMTSPHAANLSKLDENTRKALLLALEDERRAQATYQAVLNKFPDTRPFVNIVGAENRHESYLLPLFAKYGIEVPKNPFDASAMAAPDTLTEACKAGVRLENENIALYEGFFAFVKEPDIKEAFRLMQSASRDNHLPAFTRCSEGRIGAGPGRRVQG